MNGAVIREPALTPAQRAAFGYQVAFAAAQTRLSEFVDKAAAQIAAGSRRRSTALVKQAMEYLWNVDPSRYGEEDEPALRAAILRAMMTAAA